jgi:hypothetical protein
MGGGLYGETPGESDNHTERSASQPLIRHPSRIDNRRDSLVNRTPHDSATRRVHDLSFDEDA